jgi:hypothetical protein
MVIHKHNNALMQRPVTGPTDWLAGEVSGTHCIDATRRQACATNFASCNKVLPGPAEHFPLARIQYNNPSYASSATAAPTAAVAAAAAAAAVQQLLQFGLPMPLAPEPHTAPVQQQDQQQWQQWAPKLPATLPEPAGTACISAAPWPAYAPACPASPGSASAGQNSFSAARAVVAEHKENNFVAHVIHVRIAIHATSTAAVEASRKYIQSGFSTTLHKQAMLTNNRCNSGLHGTVATFCRDTDKSIPRLPWPQ